MSVLCTVCGGDASIGSHAEECFKRARTAAKSAEDYEAPIGVEVTKCERCEAWALPSGPGAWLTSPCRCHFCGTKVAYSLEEERGPFGRYWQVRTMYLDEVQDDQDL